MRYEKARASQVAQLVKNPPAMQETGFDPWVGKTPWRRERLPTPVLLGFPGGSAGKESARNAGDLGSIPGLGRSPGGGKGYPLQYSGYWPGESHGLYSPWGSKEPTRLSDFHFHFTSPESFGQGKLTQVREETRLSTIARPGEELLRAVGATSTNGELEHINFEEATWRVFQTRFVKSRQISHRMGFLPRITGGKIRHLRKGFVCRSTLQVQVELGVGGEGEMGMTNRKRLMGTGTDRVPGKSRGGRGEKVAAASYTARR